jgi:hypothetical protein
MPDRRAAAPDEPPERASLFLLKKVKSLVEFIRGRNNGEATPE